MIVYRLWKRREYGYNSLTKQRVYRDNDPSDKQEDQFFRQTNVPTHLISFYRTRESAENAKRQLEQYPSLHGDLEVVSFEVIERHDDA